MVAFFLFILYGIETDHNYIWMCNVRISYKNKIDVNTYDESTTESDRRDHSTLTIVNVLWT